LARLKIAAQNSYQIAAQNSYQVGLPKTAKSCAACTAN